MVVVIEREGHSRAPSHAIVQDFPPGDFSDSRAAGNGLFWVLPEANFEVEFILSNPNLGRA